MAIPFNISNYTKCLCPVCPVQAGSGCIAAKDDAWRRARVTAGEILVEYPVAPETYEMEAVELEAHAVGRKHGFIRPAAAEMKELYCSIGRSECGDLDGDKRCLCSDCAVWLEARLGTMYFCFQGSAR